MNKTIRAIYQGDGLAKVHFRSIAIQLKDALTSSQNVEVVQVEIVKVSAI
jgi:hypothetical protein